MKTEAGRRGAPSLALRVTAYVGAAITAIFLLFGWAIETSISRHFADQDADVLRIAAQALAGALDAGAAQSSGPLGVRLAESAMHGTGALYHVRDAQGLPVYVTPGYPDLADFAQVAAPAAEVTPDTAMLWEGRQATYRGVLLTLGPAEGGGPYRALVALPMAFHEHFLQGFRVTLWLTGLLACLAAIAASWLAVHRGHAPLRRLVADIRGISADRLHVRLDEQAVPAELRELVAAFNGMMARVDKLVRRLSEYSADIAHEMRTPVTNLTTQTSVALSRARDVEQYREVLYSNLEELERMGKMIGDMLFLAQTDGVPVDLAAGEADLGRETRLLFDYFDAWAEARGVSLRLAGEARPVRGDAAMLRRALANLLSNAIRHTPEGGTVSVLLSQEEGKVRVAVENPGETIAPEHLGRLFDRFYRADPSRRKSEEGAGLGLAIVRAIVEAHRGTVEVASADGLTRFVVTLARA